MISQKRKFSLGARGLLAFGVILSSSLTTVADEQASSATGGIKVDSYDSCVRSGGRVQEMYPPRCVSKDGKLFVESQGVKRDSCRDVCGDGECQEIVCMAVGCPCAESSQTCPTDCKGA
jgi:hypothetical protein